MESADRETNVRLECLFCKSDQFKFPSEDYEPKSGDLLECAHCGRLNDYDSLMRVAEQQAVDWATAQAEEMAKELAEDLSKAFRNL